MLVKSRRSILSTAMPRATSQLPFGGHESRVQHRIGLTCSSARGVVSDARTQPSSGAQVGRSGGSGSKWGTRGAASQNSRLRGQSSRPSTRSGGLRAIERRLLQGRNDNSTSPEGEMLFYVDA